MTHGVYGGTNECTINLKSQWRVTKVTLDAKEPDQILIQFWQGTKNTTQFIFTHKKVQNLNLFNGIEFKDETILMQQVDKKIEEINANAN